jgi:hypothetical protein
MRKHLAQGLSGLSRMIRRRGFAALTVLLVATAADAREVYFNGIKIDSTVVVKAQSFSGCDVRFDEHGDVYITAKGYNVAMTPAPRPPSPPPPPPPPPPSPSPSPSPSPAGPATTPARENTVDLSRKAVWLISKQTQRGIVQYDIDVYVNESFVRKVKSVEDPVVMDITRWIRPGENRVRMEAKKNAPDRRMSLSPRDTMEVIIGEGVLGGSTVNIDKVLIDFKRTAQETEPFIEDYSVAAK